MPTNPTPKNTLKQKVTRILRWSEKYTHTDMVYLASGGFLSLVSQTAALIGTLIFAIVISRYVSKTSYGEYKYILSIIALLSVFSLNGVGSAVLQSAAQGFNGALEKGFWTNLRWSFSIFIGGLILALYYFHSGNTLIAEGVLIGATFSPFLASASLFTAFLAGKKDFWHQTLYSIFDNLLPIGLMIVAAVYTGNPLILVAVYFISNTLAALYFYRRTKILYVNAEHKNDATMLKYSKHLSIMGIFGGIADNIDQILLFHFVGVIQLAIYNFATAIPDQMRTPIKNIDNMLQARFVGRSPEEIEGGMRNKILWYLAFLVVVIAVYFFVAPYLFGFLFPQYIDSVYYSQIYMFWILALAFDPASSYLSSRKNIKALYAGNAVYSFSQIILIFFGAIFYGLIGVIVAKIITRLILAGVNYFYYRSAIKEETLASIRL